MVPICLSCHLCFICSLSYSRKKKFPFRIIVNINHDLKLHFSLAVMLSWTQLWQNSAKVSCMLQIIILTLYLYQCYSKICWFIDWMKLPNVHYLCTKKLFKTCTALSFNVQLLIFLHWLNSYSNDASSVDSIFEHKGQESKSSRI